MNARSLGLLLFGALVTAAAATDALAGRDQPSRRQHSSASERVNNTEVDPETRRCVEAAVSALNYAAANGFFYNLTLPQPNWRVGFARDDSLDEAFFKQAAAYLKACPRLKVDVIADPGKLAQLLQGVLNDPTLGLAKLTGDTNEAFRIATSQKESAPTGPPNQPSPAPSTAQPSPLSPVTPSAQDIQPSASGGLPQVELAARQMKEIKTGFETLNGSVSRLLHPPDPPQPSTLSFLLPLALGGFALFVGTLGFLGMRQLRSTMPEPQLVKNLRDEILRSRKRGSESETLASETQRELSRIDAALRALRSEIGSLRSAPAPEQERLPRSPVSQPAPRVSEPMPPPPNSGPRSMRTPSDDEWCAAYNDALRKQNLDDFRSRHGGVWTRIQDRTTRPASLVPVDHPPERGILDGFLYVPNGHSRRGWVFPGPNYYAARSAISTGQLRLEAFSGIFESQTGEVYALRQPATAVEGRTGITIENPGLIEL
jgi:hypothetical protein